MAKQTLNAPPSGSHMPPNTGDGTEFGDTWATVLSKLNSMFTDLYGGSEGSTSGIVAGTTRTQAGATALTTAVNRIDTSTAPAAGTILGDGVALFATAAGERVFVVNNTANPVQVYGVNGGADTINGVAGATGIAVMPFSVNIFVAAAAGSWQGDVGIGFSGPLPTELAADAISAAGNSQGTATQLAALINNVTTVGAGQGVNLPGSASGLSVTVQNNGVNALTIYPKQGAADTINGIAAGTGIQIHPGTVANFNCTTAGAWTVEPVSPRYSAYNAANSAVSFTATAANISGGVAFVELDLTGNPAGAANITLPTVAALVAALHAPAIGSSFTLRIKNSANSNTWTVVTNTGWTLTGTVTILTGTWRDFVVTLNTLTTATLQNAGGGATL